MERIYAYSGTVAGLDRRLSSPLTRFMDELHQKTRELQRRLEPTGEDFEQVADAARGDR